MLTKIDEFKTQLDMGILSDKAVEYYCEKSSLNKSNFAIW